MIGSTLDHYRILGELGAGGMGIVYRAHDEQLHRDVAIKVLPQELVGPGEGRVRLRREAQALAALAHPNIAGIHSLEESPSSLALVMELVEGPTLADRMMKGRIPLPEALQVGRQIAEALECAHENGIIHRDLKPANIKVKADGTVKVLDFGLAKFLDAQPDASGATPEATTSSDIASRPGLVVGTLAYMSPEQARGSKLDQRTDIWAFGVVLYEMLSGRRAFPGASSSDVIAAIMKEDPDWGALPRNTPPVVMRLLRRCLAKEPRGRLHAIGDARLDIEEALRGLSVSRREPIAPAASRASRLIQFSLWLLLGAGVTFGATAWFRRERAVTLKPSARFSINLPSEAPLAPASAMPLAVGRSSLALSRDGTRLVYVGFTNEKTQLYIRNLENGQTRQLPSTEGAHSPFFSFDGQWIGFFARDRLKKMPVSGGEPLLFGDATLGFGGSWSEDGDIYYSTDYASRIYRVSSAGGAPTTITEANFRFQPQLFPDILPATRGVLFSLPYFGLGVHDLLKGQTRTVQEQGSFPHYVATGHLLFVKGNTLQAAPFDLKELKVTGPPVVMIDGVRSERDGAAQFAISDEGTLVYAAGANGAVGSLVWVDRQGNKRALGAPSGDYDAFRISPDGTRVAIPIRSATGIDIWLYDIERGIATRLTSDQRSTMPVWSPDGKFIYYLSWQKGSRGIVRRSVDGTTAERLLASGEGLGYPHAISPDGQWLLVSKTDTNTREDIWMVRLPPVGAPAEQSLELVPYLASKFAETLAAISPDGRWAAFTSDDTGGWEVYVCSFPHPGERIRISHSGGEEPEWSQDGRELYYRFGTEWFAVDVSLGDHFAASRPRLLFEGPFANIPGVSYGVARDGRHFLVVEGIDEAKTSGELKVVTNFFDELRRRVPSK